MASRRERRRLRRKGKKPGKDEEEVEEKVEESKPSREKGGFKKFYEEKYKLLLMLPFVLLLAAFIVIGYQVATTGDFVDKDVSLQGGLTINVLTDQQINPDTLEAELNAEFPGGDLRARAITDLGRQTGLIIDASDIDQDALLDYLRGRIDNFEESHSVESIGPSLGTSFFRQTARSIWIAFLFMGMVVFLYFAESGLYKFYVSSLSIVAALVIWFADSLFGVITGLAITGFLIYLFIRKSMPSAAVILAAFSDIIVTIAVLNILDIRLSTAGIAALLMLIGYSVDTDILLSTRVLKRKEGTLMERMYGAIKTGLTMNVTTLAAVTVALFISQSDTISQIMTILLIGLLVDVINTWFQNAGILRWYVEEGSYGKA